MLSDNRKAICFVGGIVASGFLFCAVIIRSGVGRVTLDDPVEEPKDYYITAFPPGGRKGIGNNKSVHEDIVVVMTNMLAGPGLSFGDPVLNKYNKFRYVLPCTKKGNCPKPEDEAYLDWKSLKQVSFQVIKQW